GAAVVIKNDLIVGCDRASLGSQIIFNDNGCALDDLAVRIENRAGNGRETSSRLRLQQSGAEAQKHESYQKCTLRAVKKVTHDYLRELRVGRVNWTIGNLRHAAFRFVLRQVPA